MSQVTKRALAQSLKNMLAKKEPYENWSQGLLQLFEAVLENKPFVMNVYRSVHQEQIEKYLKPLADQLILNIIEKEPGSQCRKLL